MDQTRDLSEPQDFTSRSEPWASLISVSELIELLTSLVLVHVSSVMKLS